MSETRDNTEQIAEAVAKITAALTPLISDETHEVSVLACGLLNMLNRVVEKAYCGAASKANA